MRARTPPTVTRESSNNSEHVYMKVSPDRKRDGANGGDENCERRTRPVASRRKNHGRDRKQRGGPRRCIVFAPGRRSLDAYERRALSGRSPSRHAAAHRSPSNFHKILFTLCSFYVSSTFSFSLSRPLSFPYSLPSHSQAL